MSIATEIQRLQTAKADLKTAIEGKGVTVPSSATLDDYADLVDAIETGGGGGDYEIAAGTVTPTASVSSLAVSVDFEPEGALIYVDPYSTEQNATWKRMLVFTDRVDGFATGEIVRYNNSAYGTNTSSISQTSTGSYSDGNYTFVRVGNYNFLSGTTYKWVCWRAKS